MKLANGCVLAMVLSGCGGTESNPQGDGTGSTTASPGSGGDGTTTTTAGESTTAVATTSGGSTSDADDTTDETTDDTTGQATAGGDSSSGTGPSLPPLDPGAAPGENFALEHWKITFPDASEEGQEWLAGGGEREGEFFTDPRTGGMAFVCPNHGDTTSGNTSYSRSELREMLRMPGADVSTTGINANNWVTATSSEESREAAGGVDGRLDATLSVDHVSTTGESGRVGRVIVGQIHAPDDEPCKIYYRKLPGHERGSVYFSYEPEGESDVVIPLIGSPDSDAEDPPDGIELGERWSYTIDVQGHDLEVTIEREDGSSVSELYEMGSEYDDAYLYFKAGVYNQNDGGDDDDYVRATFYALTHTHEA